VLRDAAVIYVSAVCCRFGAVGVFPAGARMAGGKIAGGEE